MASNVSTTRRKPPQKPGSSEGPKALLIAAERLFALHGVENVSLRQIVVEAGQANHFAVQHHFGDRYGLMRAVLAMRLPELEAIRARALKRARRADELDVDALVRLLFMPVAEFVRLRRSDIYARFMLQLSRAEIELGAQTWETAPSVVEVLARLRDRLAHLDDSVFALRLALASQVFLYGLVRPESLREKLPKRAYMEQVLGACRAIFEQ